MKKKKMKYIAWARVSSREQKDEGFSLDVQLDAFEDYARREKIEIQKTFEVAETGTRAEERSQFREMIAYAKKHAHELGGILFYKIDRAARNMSDFMKLEEIETRFGLPFIAITQPVQNTPTGRMVRRTLATVAAYQTEQQSLDVRDGIARRVAEGWFPSTPPFGYRNRRIDKRSYVETHPQNGNKVRRVAELRANHGLTVLEVSERMFDEGLFYCESKPKFSESKINSILHDRSYLGFIWFRGAWHPGQHEPLIDQLTWDQIRVSFNEQTYRSHELVYASKLIKCGHCGHFVTGEEKSKMTKKGLKPYIYYRCSRYRTAGHPRVRLTEQELDRQLQNMFDSVGDLSDESRSLVQMVARSILETRFDDEKVQVSESKRLLSLLETQRQKLLSRNLSGSISDALFDQQQSEFDERERRLLTQMARQERIGQGIESISGQAVQVFDVLSNDWLAMERRARQLALSALLGGFRLEGRTLVPENRTPLELFRAG
ncbi:recombinase family protein [Bremerella sp. JC817]|uniref:recombinase family protein n=1 Tax=Bremerella sp. JC817 TaxID=3231756 RepID=UPI00345B4BD2